MRSEKCTWLASQCFIEFYSFVQRVIEVELKPHSNIARNFPSSQLCNVKKIVSKKFWALHASVLCLTISPAFFAAELGRSPTMPVIVALSTILEEKNSKNADPTMRPQPFVSQSDSIRMQKREEKNFN